VRQRYAVTVGVAAAVAAALCLSACGGAKRSAPPPPPAFSHSLGTALAAKSDAVAAALASGDSCRASTLARQLQQRTIAAINESRVAAGLQEQLSSTVNALVTRVQCVPPPAPAEKGHGKHKEQHKKHKGDE
jgi:hypothetical protein